MSDEASREQVGAGRRDRSQLDEDAIVVVVRWGVAPRARVGFPGWLWLPCDAGSDEHTLQTNLPSNGQRGFEEDGNSIVWLWRLSMSGYVDAGKNVVAARTRVPRLSPATDEVERLLALVPQAGVRGADLDRRARCAAC